MKNNIIPMERGKKNYISIEPVWLQIGKSIYKFLSGINDYQNFDEDEDLPVIPEYRAKQMVGTEDETLGVRDKTTGIEYLTDNPRNRDTKTRDYVTFHERGHSLYGDSETLADKHAVKEMIGKYGHSIVDEIIEKGLA
ncbi:MAG: hypothetical protein KAS32_06690, partial [Candidatus Peribacteraceae bacterium]|nr:hypothetical protein [Candidatus Peribacteraceae bacterium]